MIKGVDLESGAQLGIVLPLQCERGVVLFLARLTTRKDSARTGEVTFFAFLNNKQIEL